MRAAPPRIEDAYSNQARLKFELDLSLPAYLADARTGSSFTWTTLPPPTPIFCNRAIMSHNKANLTKEEYMRVFLIWNVLRTKRCTRCEAEDLVCDYAKGSSFKCNACLKSKSGSVKCSWVAGKS